MVGTIEYFVTGGGVSKWADSVEAPTCSLLDAKYVRDPSSSPYVPETVPQFVEDAVVEELRTEFGKYSEILKAPETPVSRLGVVTSALEAKPFFERELRGSSLSGNVRVVNWDG